MRPFLKRFLPYFPTLSLRPFVPNVRELQSIVDYGRSRPAIDPVFGALSSSYWSSTSDAGDLETAFDVHFTIGVVGTISLENAVQKSDSDGYVRAVRSAP